MNAARRFIATTNHNAGRSIAIIGGGIGGLTAALAFARTGAKVTVYEQANALKEVGAGIQITPNGARALYALGLRDALNAVGVTAQGVAPMDAMTGRQVTRFDLSDQSPAYRFYHRADLIGSLAQGCADAGVTVQLGTRISDLQSDGSFDAGGIHVRPDLTIGADGLHSVVRAQINKATKPFFTGQVAWRAIVQAENVEPIGRIWMAPGRHVVTYPLGQGRLNIVAVQERDAWAAEGWNHSEDPQKLRDAFADCGQEICDILARVTQVNLWGLFRHPVADKWHASSIAILGDAAHPTLPFLAQGANLAIEDAYVLAHCCDAGGALDAQLQRYQTQRHARVSKAIEAANKNARNYHLSGIEKTVAHTGLRAMGALAPKAFLGRLGWLYNFDVTG